MNRKLVISVLVTAAFAAGCETVDTTKSSAVGVDRHQRMMVSSDAVNQSADKAYHDVLAQAQKRTDDELAAVMGHEIGHALREHGRERASEQMVQQLGVQVLGALTGVNVNLAQTIADVTISLPHSRTQETEADRIGVELAARAGYDPRAAVSLWQKMDKLAGGSQSPQLLSTHPSNASRIADVTQDAEKVLPLYQAAKGGTASAGK